MDYIDNSLYLCTYTRYKSIKNMETKAILDKKQHGDSVRIAQIANRLARERGLREYSEITVRQQLNGNRTLKKIVKEAAEMYYSLLNK